MSAGPGLSDNQIRNEAIQMFRDLPDNLRQNLYHRVTDDPALPDNLRDQDNSSAGYAFGIYMLRKKTEPHWPELNSIVATLIVNDASLAEALAVYPVVHKHLLAMGQVPAEDAKNQAPPPVAWLSKPEKMALPNYPDMVRAAGYIPPAQLAPQGSQGGRRKRKSRRAKRKARKTRKNRKTYRK